LAIKKRRLLSLGLVLCLSINLFLPTPTLASSVRGYFGDNNFQGCIDEAKIYDIPLEMPSVRGFFGDNNFQGYIDEAKIYNIPLEMPSVRGFFGDNSFQGYIDEAIIYNGAFTGNRPPAIDLISPPTGWGIHKSKDALTFNLKAIDPNTNDIKLPTEIYINGKLIQSFTIKDLVTNESSIYDKGQFLAINGHNYEIFINDVRACLNGDPDEFTLSVKVRDTLFLTVEKAVLVELYNSEPRLTITGLTKGQEIPKHEPNISFSIKATDADDTGEDLPISLSLVPTNIGGKVIPIDKRQEIKVNNFTANGKSIKDGILPAKNGSNYKINIDKSALLSNDVYEFILKAEVYDAYNDRDTEEIPLIHANNLPVIEIIGLNEGQDFGKSEHNLNFKLKITDSDLVDASLETEISFGVQGTYQKVRNYYVDGKATSGGFTAQSGTEYTIDLNKAGYIPIYATEFKLKVEATDTCEEKTIKELTLGQYTDILAQWSLDSAKNNIAIDSGGQGNNGFVHGPVITTGIIGDAYSFDGADNYVEVPLTPALTITTSSFSIEAWVKTTDAPTENKGIVTNYRNNTVPFWKLGLEGASKKFHFELRDTNGNYKTISAPTRLNDGQWHHLVGVRDAEQGKIRFYVDGTLAGEGDAPPGDVNSGQSIAFGEHRNQYFQGCLDEVTLYGRALSTEDVREKYEKVVFLDDLTMTNRYDDESTHPCTYGIFMNKLEFELKKTVKDLVIELEVPSSIKIREILSVSKKDAEGNYVSIIPVVGERPIADPSKVSVTENGIISFTQPLDAGSYRIELLLTVDEHLIIKSKAFYDESKIKINNDREIFWFEYMDFKELPNVT
jgi:hypothetical protein